MSDDAVRVLTAADIARTFDIISGHVPEPQPIIISPESARWIAAQGGFDAAIHRIALALAAHRREMRIRFRHARYKHRSLSLNVAHPGVASNAASRRWEREHEGWDA